MHPTNPALNLSDAEVICGFMEPRPSRLRGDSDGSGRFWRYARTEGDGKPVPMDLTLNECHEVEERLTDEQWAAYGEIHFLRAEALCGGRDDFRKGMLHATAEQKIAALASVLRGTE